MHEKRCNDVQKIQFVKLPCPGLIHFRNGRAYETEGLTEGEGRKGGFRVRVTQGGWRMGAYRSFSLSRNKKGKLKNRPVEEAKKMKCYKRLINRQFVQVSGLCGTVSELFAETFHVPL